MALIVVGKDAAGRANVPNSGENVRRAYPRRTYRSSQGHESYGIGPFQPRGSN